MRGKKNAHDLQTGLRAERRKAIRGASDKERIRTACHISIIAEIWKYVKQEKRTVCREKGTGQRSPNSKDEL